MAVSKANTRKATGRPKPVVPKAGVTRNRRRYEDGGKVKK